jgi:hypothetical protein
VEPSEYYNIAMRIKKRQNAEENFRYDEYVYFHGVCGNIGKDLRNM